MNGPSDIVELFRAARKSETCVVLEGFHALKHALRFRADVTNIASYNLEYIENLIRSHAPDIADSVKGNIEIVDEKVFQELSPNPPESKMIALAKKPEYLIESILKDAHKDPIVLLDNPSHPGNVGSAIRVSAAAGAYAVLVTGNLDPWRPQVLRGSQGLHFALPVLHIDNTSAIEKPIIAFDERGKDMQDVNIPKNAIFVFGSERRGVSDGLKKKADHIFSIPMQEGVSSINLATSVGIVLYSIKLGTL